MSDPTHQFPNDDVSNDVANDQAANDAPTAPTPPVTPDFEAAIPAPWAPPSSWPAPPAPAWGSAPQGWPPPPAPPMMPPVPSADPVSWPAYGPATPPLGSATPPFGTPAAPPPGFGAGGGGGSWNYGYGQTGWGSPPAPRRPPTGPRRAIIAIAIAVLVIASAGVGAAISAAVHTNTNDAAQTSPIPGAGSSNNGNGFSSGDVSPATRAIAAKVEPAVVDIYTTIDTGLSQTDAAGTGMVITPSGEVLTNNHVIDGASTVQVELVGTGERRRARVLGYDVVDDVALLQIEGVSNLPTVDFADLSTVGIGDSVVALGNAGGRGGTPAATSGSVTALDQKVTAGDAGSGNSETLHGMIQISAPIEPGDSGGPLVDTDGKVIGMNTAAAQNDNFFPSASSTAFAIPTEKAIQIAHQIEAGNDSDTVHVGERGILGVRVQNIGQNGTLAPTTSGASIAGAQAGGPADSAGISEGDVITSIDGKSITNASDLTARMFPYHPDDRVRVGWVDGSGQAHRSTLKLIKGPPN